MSIQSTIVEAVNRAMSSQNRETAVPTADLARMIQEGESQIEDLFTRLKEEKRQSMILKDRVVSQKDTIDRQKDTIDRLSTNVYELKRELDKKRSMRNERK